MTTLERSLANNEGDRRKLLDKINKLKASEARHENEIKRTKESLDGSEQRQTETEVKRRKIEGELQVSSPVIFDLLIYCLYIYSYISTELPRLSFWYRGV